MSERSVDFRIETCEGFRIDPECNPHPLIADPDVEYRHRVVFNDDEQMATKGVGPAACHRDASRTRFNNQPLDGFLFYI